MNNPQATIGKPSTESSPPGKRPRFNKMNNRTTKAAAHLKDNNKPPMHSGRWTPEEEKYVEGMIAEFKAGLLPIVDGTTLRSFLAKMLSCSPKRVSKKWDSSKIYNGKLAYVGAKTPLPLAEACARQENLLELERQFREALSTMQRVESRLKSLTTTTETRDCNHTTVPAFTPALTSSPTREQQTASSESGSGMMPLMESWKSSSAASSLTADDDEDDTQLVVTAASSRIGEKSKTQVSADGDSDRKPAAAVTVSRSQGSDEQTAGKMLLMLGSCSRKRTSSEACLDATFDGDVVLQKLHKSQARDEAAAQVKSLVLSTAPLTGATHQTSASSQESDANLQNLLQKLQELKQHQQEQQQQYPSSSNSNGLREFLGNPSTQQQHQGFGSPIDQPQNTRQSLQGFLHSLQQKGGHHEQHQQQSLQQQEQEQHTDLQGLLQAFQQQQLQNQYQQGQLDQQPTLQSILQMIAQRQQSQMQSHQNPEHLAKVLQSLFQTQQARHVSQQAMTSLQGLLQSLTAHQAARQQQHMNLDGVVTTLLDQLRNNVSSRIYEQVRNGSSAASSSGSSMNNNNSALEGLLQSLAGNHNKHNQQAGSSAPEPLQQLLLQFVQQNNNGDSSSSLSHLR